MTRNRPLSSSARRARPARPRSGFIRRNSGAGGPGRTRGKQVSTRAGYRPGRGYVHPAEAADEILDEALQPFLDDLQRRAGLGTRPAAVELAVGILLGLYNCRHGNSETLLEYSPDYAAERASGVVSDCARLGIELPTAELLDLMPEWSALPH